MSITINYTKAQYQAKITELEGYYNQLSIHLTRMEELKSQIPNFWNDQNGQKSAQILVSQIRYVQKTMDSTTEMLNFYKSLIDEMEGTNLAVSGILEEAIKLLAK